MKKYYLLTLIVCSISSIYAQFKGGQHDGYFALLLQSTNNCPLFAGGSGDGYDTATIIGGCIMYKGDTATGYYAAELSNPNACVQYRGSAGYGYKSDSLIRHIPCILLSNASSPLQARMESTHRGLLTWDTYLEHNTARFELQKSEDGIHWHVLGYVNGHGTTTTTHSYNFVDANATAEKQYYRYRQIDVDGSFIYSNVAELSNSDKPTAAFSIYPNPATDVFTIQYWGEQDMKVSIALYDMLGREVLRQELPTLRMGNSAKIPCEHLSAGAYMLSIQTENATYQRTNARIIIAK